MPLKAALAADVFMGVVGCMSFILPGAYIYMYMIIGIKTYIHHIYIIYIQGMFISMSYIMIVRFLILRSYIICHAYIKTIKLYIYTYVYLAYALMAIPVSSIACDTFFKVSESSSAEASKKKVVDSTEWCDDQLGSTTGI
jgi:hypothetical protein